MKIVSSSIQIATLILISCTLLFAAQHEQSWEYKDWQVDTHNDFVRCVTHGQVVHGHEFAIVKRKRSNNQNLLYISWSTSNKGLTKHEGRDAVLRLQIDDIRRQVTLPLLSVKELHPGLTVGTFTNIAVGEEFISLLQKGHKLEVTIHGPDELVNTLDITSDTFSLDGFTATLLKAQEFCELTGQGESSAIHAQQTQKVNEASRITETDIDPKEDKNVHSTLATEPTSRRNIISSYKEKTSNERHFPITLAIVAILFILGIFSFIKYAANRSQEGNKVVNQESNEQQATIDFKHSDKEKDLIEILVSTLSVQQSLFCDQAGRISQRVKDNWSMGYVYGYSDAFLQHNGYTGTNAELERLRLLITTLNSIFDGQGKEHLQRIARLQKINDIQYTEGLSKGSTEMINWLQDDKNIPLGWAIYVDEIPPEDMEKPKVIPLQANTESTQDALKDSNSYEKSFSYPETQSNEESTLKLFFENTGSFLFIALFVGGYFPVNMILAFVFGDKMDVVISLFVPFYGYIVMLF
jgi:hypothetical protein